MPAVAIAFPLSSSPGRHPQESGGRLINCYAEPLGEGARAKASYRRVPGSLVWGTTAPNAFRGMQLVGSVLYAVVGTTVYTFTSGGGAGTAIGTLPGSSKISWGRNNRAPIPDLIAVSPGDGAFVVTSSSVSTFPDTDLPVPNSVVSFRSFFLFTIGDGKVYASALNDTAIDALDFATAESKPDTLLRVIPYASEILLAGTNSIEVWGPPINAAGFPFSYVTTIPKGLASAYAIAGYEDGLDQKIVFVADDNTVRALSNGYEAVKISPPDLDRLIEAVTDKTTIEAGAFVAQGHQFVAISSPTWTWVFDLNTTKWHERESYGLTRWRGTQPHYAFGKWLVGDTDTGNILAINGNLNTEADEPLRMRLESGQPQGFPQVVSVPRAEFDVTLGVGDATGAQPNQTDPMIEVSWTDDGGVNWSDPMIRPLGAQALANGRIMLPPTGMTGQKGRRWRLDIADPVTASIMGGQMYVSPRGGL